ncbi:MAG: serine hydrolase [Acidobacteria bacterium]|nr:serine hydrolase [Acidobacteriota bacterium]
MRWPVFLLTLPVLAQAPLEQRARTLIAGFQGTVSLFARNLDTGRSFGLGENERVRTASTIKLPIMTAVFAAVAEGSAKWTDELVLREADRVSGSGVVREMSAGARLPLRDLVHLMIVVSDNTATNLLLDRFPADTVNERMDRLGLTATRCLRKILAGNNADPSGVSRAGRLPGNQRFGLGVSTPREMVMLLEKLERGEVVSREASQEMLAILKRQQYRDGIARKLGDLPVASKSGALDRLRSDVGIVYAPGGRIALGITCDDMPRTDYSPDNPGNLLIAGLTQLLIEGLSKP